MKLILKNTQTPGNTLLLTALIRDIKKAFPEWSLAVDTAHDEVFLHNPNVTKISPQTDKDWARFYPSYGTQDNPLSIHKHNIHKKHIINGMIGHFNSVFNTNIKLTEPKPDLYLSEKEKSNIHPVYLLGGQKEREASSWNGGIPGQAPPYWVVFPGSANFLRKPWPKRNWEELFKLLPGTDFVQLGGSKDNHSNPSFEEYRNVLDLSGKTTLRQALSLIYNAEGVICPITFSMHAAAAFDKKCIVIAGGGEPPSWSQYPGHTYLHTIGQLPCCEKTGCFKSDCKNMANDGEQRCMKLITAEMVAEIVRGDM